MNPWHGIAGAQRVEYRAGHELTASADSNLSILLLHGMANSSIVWTSVLEQLAALSPGLTVAALDIPGHGGSTLRGVRLRTHTVTATIDAFCRRYMSSRVIVVGHSLGSAIALELAYQAPEIVSGCLLFNGPPVPMMDLYAHPLSTALRDRRPVIQLGQILLAATPGMRRLIAFKARNTTGLDGLLSSQVGVLSQMTDSDKRLAITDLGRGSIAKTVLGGFGYDYRQRYKSITAPCHIILGALDATIRESDVTAFLEGTLPAATCETWPGVGHLPMLEDPARTTRAVLNFLESIQAPR